MKTVSELVALLNKYPHIQKNITEQWGKKSCKDYLVNLILSDRINRQGFTDSKIEIIEELKELHDHFYPEFDPPDIWNNSTYRDRL